MFSVIVLYCLSIKITSKTNMEQNEVLTPDTRQIRFRCFLQYLEIDLFLQSFCQDMKKQYYIGEADQKTSCQFTLYIFSLQNYMNMCKLNKQRLQMGERFQELEHRIYQTRFTKHIIMLKGQIQKAANRLKKNEYLARFAKVFVNPDLIVPNIVFEYFKNCLNEYAYYLNQDLKADNTNKENVITLKLLTKIYIARFSSFLLGQLRTEIFQPFLRNEKSFDIKKILSKINECNDNQMLRGLLKKYEKIVLRKVISHVLLIFIKPLKIFSNQ